MFWAMLHRDAAEYLGHLPAMLSEGNERSAREQLDFHYQAGGGWQPTAAQFEMGPDGALHHEGDPPMPVLAEAKLRDEVIRLYHYSFVAVVQPDGSYEIARMD